MCPSLQHVCIIIATLLLCGGHVAEASSSKTSEVAKKLLEKILVKELLEANQKGCCFCLSSLVLQLEYMLLHAHLIHYLIWHNTVPRTVHVCMLDCSWLASPNRIGDGQPVYMHAWCVCMPYDGSQHK